MTAWLTQWAGQPPVLQSLEDSTSLEPSDTTAAGEQLVDPKAGWGWGGAMSLGRSLASCQDISVTKKEVSVPGRTGGGGLMKLEALAEGPVLCSDALPSALSV